MLTHRLSHFRILLFLLVVACVLFLSSFFITTFVFQNDTPIEYHQISENVQSTDKDVNAIELSNKIILSSNSKEPTDIKILNPNYETYQINHYDDNCDLIGSKIVNSTEIQCLTITDWSTYEILGIDNISYGDGWTHYDYVDGTQAHKLVPSNYLRWDGEWRPKTEMNFSSGDWPYIVEDLGTYYHITRLDDSLNLSKTYRTYDFQKYKIGVQLTLTPTELNAMSTPAGEYWYITIPKSLKQTSKHLNWDNKLPIISNESGTILNQSDNVSGEWLPNYKYENVGGELRLYYGQIARNFGIASTEITFDFNSYIINSSTGWANTSYSNFAYDRNTGYLILPDNVTDGLVLYHKMSGSSGITSYDMNLTSDNNGTLTNMNTGLDNGSSGWNTSGKYGNAIAFDGVDDYVDCGNDASLEITDVITIEVWVKFDNLSGKSYFLAKGKYKEDGWYWRVLEDGSWSVAFNRINGADWPDSGINLPIGEWLHLTTVLDNVTPRVDFYKNGEWLAYTSPAYSFIGNVDRTLLVGKSHDGFPHNGSIDSVRVYNRALSNDEINQTMLDTMKTIDNVTHWHDAGTGYQTSSFIVNMTTPTNTNYTIWYADNGSSFTQIGGIYTGNQTPLISGTKYQNTDLQIIMNGNTTATPEEMEVTFVTETSAVAPNITSWQNNKTSNNTLDITINTSEEVNFNATANQTITTWNWYKDDVDQSHNYDNITLNWSSTGLKHVIVNVTNTNGTSSSITWNVTVEGAEPVITLLSQTPSTIYKNSTGSFQIIWDVVHSAVGLNHSRIYHMWNQYDYGIDCYCNSIRFPSNNKAANFTPTGEYILRQDNRNGTALFEEDTRVTEGTIGKWGGVDKNSARMNIVEINSTNTQIYINGTAQDMVFPNSWPLNRIELEDATKTAYSIYVNHPIIIKWYDIEAAKGNSDYIVSPYFDTELNGLTPTFPIEIYYHNGSFDPLGAVDIEDSPDLVYVTSITGTDWINWTYSPRPNADYVNGMYLNSSSIVNAGVTPNKDSFWYLKSQTSPSRAYDIMLANSATSTNRSFAQTDSLWIGNTAPYTAHPYTASSFTSFSRGEHQINYRLFVTDNNSVNATSANFTSNISASIFPPTNPTINHFHYQNETDYNMDGIYSGNFSIGCGVSTDPDGGDVTHNLTLHYADNLTLVTIINNTFTDKDITHNGVYHDSNFSSIPYYSDDVNYTLRLIATDDESESVTVWLNKNFTLSITPIITSYTPSTPVTTIQHDTQYFTINISQIVNVTWYIDGSVVSTENSVNYSSYSNSTAPIDIYNVTAHVENVNGTRQQVWEWEVEDPIYSALLQLQADIDDMKKVQTIIQALILLVIGVVVGVVSQRRRYNDEDSEKPIESKNN